MDSRFDTLLHRLVALLGRHTGTLPRRAVLTEESTVCDLRDAPPGSRECHLLSTLCDAVREARGDRIIPRDVAALLAECVHTDDDAMWTALCDDALARLLTHDIVRAHFETHPHDAVAFIHRYRAAHTPDQATRILKVFSVCVPEFGAEAHSLFVTELYHNDGIAYLMAFANAAKSLPVGVRMMALTSMGRQIRDDAMYRPLVRGLFVEHPVIHDDVLFILMASPCAPSLGAMFDDPHATLRHTASAALKAPVPRRGPYLEALTHLASHLEQATGTIPADALNDLHMLILHTARFAQDAEVVRRASALVRVIEHDSLCGHLAAAYTRATESDAKNLGSE
jgi:hypothetical protein